MVIPTGNVASDRLKLVLKASREERLKADVIATSSVGGSQDKGRGGGVHWGA